MKKLIVNLCVLLCVSGSSRAQLLRSPVANGYASTGSGSLQHADIFTATVNPAALAQLANTSIGVYTERRFLLKEITAYTLASGVVTRYGNFGAIARYAGYNLYNESEFSLLHARQLGAKADIGVQFNYHHTRIANYGSLGIVGFGIASVWHLPGKIHAGVQINNPIGKKHRQAMNFPSIYTTALGYEASRKFFAGMSISKESRQPVNVQVALQYKLLSTLMARIGISSATSSAWAGAGLSWKNMRADIITGFHPQLGITPALLLLFNAGRNAP